MIDLRAGACAVILLLVAVACRPVEAPSESRQLPVPDLAGVEGVQRRQIELLLAALERDREAGGDELAERYGELGNAYHIAELLDAAAEAYGDARRLAPGDVRWPYYAGMVHDARGDLEAAATGFRRALELAPEDPAAQLRLADVELRLGRLQSARELYAAALERDPASAAAHHGLARLATIRGDPEAAARHLEQALELAPEAGGLHYPLAQAYRKLGDEERARLHLGQRGEGEPRFPDPLADRLSRVKTLTAFELVEARAGEPVAPPARPAIEVLADEDFLGFVIEQVGKVEAAPEQLARMLERGPAGEPAAGAPAWRARMHYAIGGLLARRGSDIEAAGHFEQALELRPDLRDARLRLANGLARLRRFEEAAAQYSIFLESDPEDAGVLLKRATVRLNLGRLESAEADLRRVIAIESGNGMAHLRLAAVLRRTGPPDEAILHLEQALAADLPAADRRLGHQTLATLLLASRRDREALAHLQAATSLAPDDIELRRRLARLLATSPDDTVRDGERALVLAEALFGADRSLSNAETMAMALAAAGRFEEAANWQRRLIAEVAKFGHMDQIPRLRKAQDRYKQRLPARPPDPE